MSDKQIIIGQTVYHYELLLSERKTETIYVSNDVKITVKAPLHVNIGRIEAFIRRKGKWLAEQLEEVKKYRQIPEQKRYLSGSSLLYLGRQYKVVVKSSVEHEKVQLLKNQIFIFTKQDVRDDVHNGSLVKSWYGKQQNRVFRERFKLISAQFPDFDNPKLVVTKMKNRWGCYRVNETIVLNPDLIKASKQCIDYVLYHEFCHHYFKKHNADFYKMLDEKMPDWKKVKEKLEMRFTSG